MSPKLRTAVRLLVALAALGLTGLGPAAFAAQPVPDPASDGVPALPPPPPLSVTAATSVWQEVAWMATGAAAVLLLSVVVVALVTLSRHRGTAAQPLAP